MKIQQVLGWVLAAIILIGWLVFLVRGPSGRPTVGWDVNSDEDVVFPSEKGNR